VIRDFRAGDAPAMVHLLTTQFPEEEALMGTRPETFFRVVRRVMRWDARILFGFLRLLGRPVFRLLIFEEDTRLVGTTLLTFPAGAVYLSMVVVDPAARRRGYARALLGRAAEIAQRMRRRYLVLDVLANNAPARTLYEQRLGYRPLREVAFMVREHPEEVGTERTALPPGIRRFEERDNAALVALAQRQTPPEVAEVMAVPRKLLADARTTDRIFESQTEAWVVDRGSGPEALAVATCSSGREAAHLSDPIVGESADPALVSELYRTAVAWCGARHAVRVMSSVPRYNTRGRAALEREGFHDALSTWTLYRPVA
jgi:ribosomal protein S18 acetylase RimI-like enzyme